MRILQTNMEKIERAKVCRERKNLSSKRKDQWSKKKQNKS